MQLPTLESDRLVVRVPDVTDIDSIIEYYAQNKEHLGQFAPPSPPEFFTKTFWAKRIKEMQDEYKKDCSCKTIIAEKTNPSQVIGVANLFDIMRGLFQAVYLGYSIAASHEGQGYMKEALGDCIIPYAFNDLNLHRIMANYQPENEKSGKLLKSLHFEQEGLGKDYLWVNGKWVDHILTARINPDWKDRS